MVQTRIVTPKVAEGFVSRQTNLGVDNYDLDELCSPDTAQWRGRVLDLGSLKYPPQVATAPTRYIFDRSRYNNHGAITGAIWKQLPGGEWVLNFDGDDWVLSANATTDSNVFTFEGWVKPTAAALAGNGIIISHGASPTDNGWSIYSIDLGGGTYGERITFHGVANYDSTAGIVANVWQHIFVTLSGTALSFYLNGVAIGTAVTAAMGIGSHKYSLAATPAGATINPGIQIARPRVFDMLLSMNSYQRERHIFGV